MAAPFDKVAPGDPLRISARTFNTFVEAATAYRNRQFDIARRPQPGVVHGNIRIRNDTGGDRQAFDVVSIVGPVFGPDDNLTEFQRRVTMRVGVPDVTAVAAGRVAILAEPLAAGRIGRAYIYGTCAARVKILDPSHVNAVPVEGVTDYLESAAEGPIQILWNDSVSIGSVAWSLIRFGGGGGGIVQIRLARLVGFWFTEGEFGYAIGYLGYLIDAINAPRPSPEPSGGELLNIRVMCTPQPNFGRDLRYSVPPVELNVIGRSDRLVTWVNDASISPEEGGGYYQLVTERTLTCMDG